MNANLAAELRAALERRLDNYSKSLQHCSAPAREDFQMRVEATLKELELLDRLAANSRRTDDGQPASN
jgi:hypothetical protein